MTRYALLKLIRRLVEALPGWERTTMPRVRSQGFTTLWVTIGERSFKITVEEL